MLLCVALGLLLECWFCPLNYLFNNISKTNVMNKKMHWYFCLSLRYDKREWERGRKNGKNGRAGCRMPFILFTYSVVSLCFFWYQQWLLSILDVFLQPAGWFFEWEGFGHLFFRSKEGSKDLQFYATMTKVQYTTLIFMLPATPATTIFFLYPLFHSFTYASLAESCVHIILERSA